MNDEDFRALQEQAHHLNELTRHPGWEVYLDYLRFGNGGAAVRQTQILNGTAKDHVDYNRKVGWLEGVEFAIQAPRAVQDMVSGEAQRRQDRLEDDGA